MTGRTASDPGRGEASLRREAFLWGAVGGLAFLVLLSGYELWTGWRAGLLLKFGLAVVVAGVTAVLTAAFATRLRENESA